MKINTPEYQKFLDSIELHQEVAYQVGNVHPDGDENAFWEIAKITRITPNRHFRSGEIKISSVGKIQNPYPRLDLFYTEHNIYPVTDEIRSKVARQELLYDVQHINFHALSTEVLNQILALSKATKKEEHYG